MTFTRNLKTPIYFLAHKTGSGENEALHIQLGITNVDIPREDAKALAAYIQEHWPEGDSD